MVRINKYQNVIRDERNVRYLPLRKRDRDLTLFTFVKL